MTQTTDQSDRKAEQPRLRWFVWALLVFATVLFVTWVHRITVVMIYYFNNNGFSWHYQAIDGFNPLLKFFETYGEAVLLGLKTDILFALPITLVLVLAGRFGLYAGLLVLAVFYAANAEHIRFNESNLDVSLIGLALSPTFISGQATLTLLQAFLGFLLFGAMVVWFARRALTRIAVGVVSICLALAAAMTPASVRYDQPIWMQTHPLMPMIGVPELPIDDRSFSPDVFSAAPLPSSPIPSQYNVLLVFLEGLSENSLSISDMSYVQSVAAENIHFRQYIGHQLLTANAIYATHTGRMPYFTNVAMRWYDLDRSSPEIDEALPMLLRNEGYQTAFIQSAPLQFMRKDEILPLMGYDDIIGAESIPNAYQRNGWGVDDLTLMETALAYIDQVEEGRPWFISLLTTGTHSPYNVPPDFLPNTNNDRYRASRYADEAVHTLMVQLEERGLLENTVVIITSDESREYSPGTQLETDLHRSWLPFIAIHPTDKDRQIDKPFAMMDARDMILAMTGDVTDETYNTILDRRDAFVAGNVRLRQLFHFTPDSGELFACHTGQFVCHLYDNVDDIRDMTDASLEKVARFPQLERLLRAREGAEIDCDYDIAICE